jgi:hypothetical protein
VAQKKQRKSALISVKKNFVFLRAFVVKKSAKLTPCVIPEKQLLWFYNRGPIFAIAYIAYVLQALLCLTREALRSPRGAFFLEKRRGHTPERVI